MPTVSEFKQRVEKEWGADETAAAWKKHYPSMKEQLADVTKALVAAADPRPGMLVLDLASGTGEPSLSLARAVAPTGRVTATDLNPNMLEALTANARAEGIANIGTRVCDAHALPFPDASFDLVTSRFGVMFFAEVDRALASIKRVLKSGGRVAFMVWGAPEPGTFFGTMVTPFVRRVAVKPDPDGPGPMRFAEPGKLARLIEAAAFGDVNEQRLLLPAPYRGSPDELLGSTLEIAAPFRAAVASLSEDDRKAAEREVAENLRPLYDGTFTRVTAPVVIVTASA
jgi:SAM-dependent methyltransferase